MNRRPRVDREGKMKKKNANVPLGKDGEMEGEKDGKISKLK